RTPVVDVALLACRHLRRGPEHHRLWQNAGRGGRGGGRAVLRAARGGAGIRRASSAADGGRGREGAANCGCRRSGRWSASCTIPRPLRPPRFRGTSPMLRTAETVMGPTALLGQGGVEVLVASIRQQPIHREVFTHIGVDLSSRAIVALKSSAHFRAGFQEIAEAVIVCLAPG